LNCTGKYIPAVSNVNILWGLPATLSEDRAERHIKAQYTKSKQNINLQNTKGVCAAF